MSVWLVLLLSHTSMPTYPLYHYIPPHHHNVTDITESPLVTHSTQLKITTQTYL